MVGNNTPVFFVRDPSKFQDFIHSQKRLPDTGPALQRHAVGLLDAVARERPPGDDPHVRPRDPGELAAHGRLLQPHVLVGQRRRRALLGQVPLQDEPGDREPHRGRGRADGRRGRRPPPPRPARRDRLGRRAGVDVLRAGDAVRRRRRLPLQPVRPHEGLAEGRLPADRGRPDGARSQPGQLLRRGRAGGLQPLEPRARHRPVARPDADGARLQLPRHAPAPHRPQLRAAPDQPPAVPRALLQQGRAR